MKIGRIFIGLGIFAFLLSSGIGQQRAVLAAPNGKTWTLEIAIGAGLIYYGSLAIRASERTARNMAIAQDVFKEARPSLAATCPCPTPTPRPLSTETAPEPMTPKADLAELRVQVINYLMLETVPAWKENDGETSDWRRRYEQVRGCWNGLVFSAKDDFTKSCIYSVFTVSMPDATRLDNLDATAAFAGYPTLFQQIIDSSTGQYEIQNRLRADAAYISAASFIDPPLFRMPPHKPKQTAPTVHTLGGNPISFISDCLSNAGQCVGNIQGAEAGLASQMAITAACTFARAYWLPPYTAIAKYKSESTEAPAQVKKAISEGVDFGPVPGCS